MRVRTLGDVSVARDPEDPISESISYPCHTVLTVADRAGESAITHAQAEALLEAGGAEEVE